MPFCVCVSGPRAPCGRTRGCCDTRGTPTRCKRRTSPNMRPASHPLRRCSKIWTTTREVGSSPFAPRTRRFSRRSSVCPPSSVSGPASKPPRAATRSRYACTISTDHASPMYIECEALKQLKGGSRSPSGASSGKKTSAASGGGIINLAAARPGAHHLLEPPRFGSLDLGGPAPGRQSLSERFVLHPKRVVLEAQIGGEIFAPRVARSLHAVIPNRCDWPRVARRCPRRSPCHPAFEDLWRCPRAWRVLRSFAGSGFVFLQSRSARRMWGTRRSWTARRRSRSVCLALLSAGVAEGPGVAEHRPSRAHANLGALSERRKASVSVGGEGESGKNGSGEETAAKVGCQKFDKCSGPGV